MKSLRSFLSRILPALAFAGFVSCGEDTVAGKTTTTTNGGGNLQAVGPSGQPLSGCVALAARSWDPVRGMPGAVDTLRGDGAGTIRLERESYAFLEIRDDASGLGARIQRVSLPDGNRQMVRLDTLRRIQGRWADRSSVAAGRLFLDSSFHSVALGGDGSFVFRGVSEGAYALLLDANAAAPRRMGSVRLEERDVRFLGPGNVILQDDTTGSPLWIDDFETGSVFPPIHGVVPGVSPWYVWASLATTLLPASTEVDSIRRAIGPDPDRAGNSFHFRFATDDPYSWVAVGITNMEMDLSERTRLCFAYRSDSLVKIQFQRDSVGMVRPAVSASVPSSREWKDVCVATSDLVANADNPDSLKTWNSFGKKVLVIEFQVPSGGTFLDLDDIRMR